MKSVFLIVIGLFLTAAGIAGFIHPQWQGQDKKIEVDVGSKQLEVTTRRVTDIPPVLSGAVLVAGVCTFALGGILRAREKPSR